MLHDKIGLLEIEAGPNFFRIHFLHTLLYFITRIKIIPQKGLLNN